MKKLQYLSLATLVFLFIKCEEDNKPDVAYGTINESIIGVGSLNIDLNKDLYDDYQFEIINLKQFNNENFNYTDSLAARVHSYNWNQILDNSTYGYPDALNYNDKIEGRWNAEGVLGTIGNGGLFEGKGTKYLGIKFINNGSVQYGWIRIYCSAVSDTLKVIDYGFNRKPDQSLKAGEL